jgi:hypothetical protein
MGEGHPPPALQFAPVLALALATAITTAPLRQITSVGRDFPRAIDAKQRYVFYLHGRIIEEHGLRPRDPRYGIYEYEDILRALEAHSLRVISEARPKGTDAEEYAKRIRDQIAALLQKKVPPEHITVIGASKGSLIAMLVSMVTANDNVRYVLMANCNDDVLQQYKIDLHGAVLSIFDEGDAFGGTCSAFFARATGLSRQKEIVTHLRIGHALLYQPRRAWMDPAIAWAKEKP